MDGVNRKIIAKLQSEGRISLTELSENVGISLSSCQRRVKALESEIITGYRAQIDAHKVGLTFSALVFVTVSSSAEKDLAAFERELQNVPEIIQAQRLFGEPDYLLQIVTRDLQSYQILYDKSLTTLPNVKKMMSTLVMKDIVLGRGLPL